MMDEDTKTIIEPYRSRIKEILDSNLADKEKAKGLETIYENIEEKRTEKTQQYSEKHRNFYYVIGNDNLDKESLEKSLNEIDLLAEEQKSIYKTLLKEFTKVKQIKSCNGKCDPEIQVVEYESFDKEEACEEMGEALYIAANPSTIIKEEDIEKFAYQKAVKEETKTPIKRLGEKISGRFKRFFQ